jgi:pimeloyl-ACP methyl ester carboxylesterase
VEEAVAEAELRWRHGLAAGSVALVGASIGAFVALNVHASGQVPVSAIALVSPALRLTSVVAATERAFAVTYQWSDASRAVAAELDLVARAPDVVRRGTPTLFVVGADDDYEGIARPAEELAAALLADHIEAAIIRIPDMGHAIADEPGLEPAPQTPAATAVDDVVSAWLKEHLA